MMKADQDYLIHPKVIVRKAIEYLIIREKKDETKRDLKDLLEEP